jgi:hypothetical protein
LNCTNATDSTAKPRIGRDWPSKEPIAFNGRVTRNCKCTKPRPPSRGLVVRGPYRGLPFRPRADRTRGLDLEQVKHLLNAAVYAEAAGMPLNAMVTIRWIDAEGFDPSVWAAMQTRLLDKMGRWLRERGVNPAFVWVRERVPGVGCHTHALVHLGPKPLAVAADLTAYLLRTGRFQRSEGVFISLGKFGAQTVEARAGLRCYVAKGLDHRLWRYTGVGDETENLGAVLGLDHRGSQGVVEIKRSGFSQSLGPAARRRAGYQDVRDLPGLRRMLHPDEVE